MFSYYYILYVCGPASMDAAEDGTFVFIKYQSKLYCRVIV